MNRFTQLNQQTIVSTSIAFQNRKLALLSKNARLRNIRIKTGIIIENFFFSVCEKLSIYALVECGAHDGSISVKFCGDNTEKYAISFEANPFVVERFSSTIINKNIQYLNFGLAKTPGILQLNIPSHSPKSWTPQSSFNRNLTFNEFSQIDVKVDTLDNLISQYFFKPISVNKAIWIDVEGFGWEVLNGATNLLSSQMYPIIFMEVQDQAVWENERNASEICEYLENYGYVPVVRDCPLANLYNIVFVKKEFVDQISELINIYWLDFASIKPGFYEKKSLRTQIGDIKKKIILTSPNFSKKYMHKIFAKLGSRSSKDFE